MSGTSEHFTFGTDQGLLQVVYSTVDPTNSLRIWHLVQDVCSTGLTQEACP